MRPNDSLDDLDTRIQLAEQRLIARQNRLRSQVALLGDEVRETLRPQRLLAPAAAGAGTLLSLWWWLARRRKSARLAAGWRGVRPPGPAWPVVAAGAAGLPWLQILGLVGPVLAMARKLAPEWRSQRSHPRLADDPVPEAAAVADRLDRERWAGRWLEAAATPVRQASQTPAAADLHYLLRADGDYDVVRRRIDTHGRQRTERGVAHPVPGSGGARMRISLWPAWLRVSPLSWDDHQVLHVDDDYAAALVSPRGGSSLSLLTRESDLPDDRVQSLLRIARERGYPVERLRFTRTGRHPG